MKRSIALYLGLALNNGMEKEIMFSEREHQLIQIVEAGDVAMLRLALDAGALPLAIPSDFNGHSPLMAAVYLGQLGCAREMISRGGAERRNRCGHTTLTIAAQSLSENAWSCIKALIDSGRDPLEGSDRGETPLMWALSSGNPRAEEIARSLLAWGGANAKTLSGETPLMWAVQESDEDWGPALLASAGADPLIGEGSEGASALMMACGRRHHKATKALLDAFPGHAEAMCRQASSEGITALMAAAEAGSEECARLVLPWSDLRALDHKGNSALHKAHLWPVAEILLAAGANIFQRNHKGETPTEALSLTGSNECFRNLSAREAAMSEALALAESMGHLGAAKKRPLAL